MKINRLSVIAGLVLGGLVACTGIASAQDQKPAAPRGRGPSVERQMERLTEDLKLTDEQKPKIKAALEATNKKMQELREAGTPREEMREKMRSAREAQDKKFKEVLTADQYSQYEKLREQMRQGGGGRKAQEKKN